MSGRSVVLATLFLGRLNQYSVLILSPVTDNQRTMCRGTRRTHSSCADPKTFLRGRGCLASDQGRILQSFIISNPYLRKSRGFGCTSGAPQGPRVIVITRATTYVTVMEFPMTYAGFSHLSQYMKDAQVKLFLQIT